MTIQAYTEFICAVLSMNLCLALFHCNSHLNMLRFKGFCRVFTVCCSSSQG